ncbi:MAG: single-stranded DNA-binding protein [Candidatus Margulisbacteria bacterium]|jgi:single stranded DNA-binding protein|nr:single-stranded DNA-binding protein [Candidatus Margulisiibacteriota bacterium]
MSNFNRIILLGTVQAKPETRFGADNNTTLSKFTLSVARPPRQDGQTDYDSIPIVAFGRAADYAAENARAGAAVLVEGKIQTTQTENNGSRVWHTEVNAALVRTLAPGAPPPSAGKSAPETAENPFGTQDDIPF